MPRWLWSLHALDKGTAPARGLSPSAHGRGATCQLRPPRTSRLSRGTCERTTALTVSREEAHHASFLRARAVARWLWSVHALGKGTAPAKGPSPSACGCCAMCQRWPPRVGRLSRGTRGRATLLAVSREKAQHSSLLCARTVPRWLWSFHALDKGTAPARGLAPSARGRGATCQLWPPRISRLSRGTARARHCAHCLSGGGASRKLAARARRAALVVVGLCTRQGHCTGERPLFFDVRLLCDVPAVATQNRPAFAWHARARHFARCFSGEGAALELAVRAHRAALAVVVPRIRQGHCTGERSRSFGARPWCDVPVVATQNQPAFAWHRAGAPLRSLSLGRRRVTQACCARAPCRAGCCRFMHKARALHRRKASLLRRAAVVRRASGGPQNRPAFAWHARARHCARCFLGEGAGTRACCPRAPCRAGCGRSTR